MSEKLVTRQIRIPEAEWKALADLSVQTNVPTDDLVREAVEQYLVEKSRIARAREALRRSFGLWKNRDDLAQDSVDLVNELREEWHARTRRLDLRIVLS